MSSVIFFLKKKKILSKNLSFSYVSQAIDEKNRTLAEKEKVLLESNQKMEKYKKKLDHLESVLRD